MGAGFRLASLGINGIFGAVYWYAAQDLNLVVYPAFSCNHVASAHAPTFLLRYDSGAVIKVKPPITIFVAHPWTIWPRVTLSVVLLVTEEWIGNAMRVLVTLLIPGNVVRLLELSDAVGSIHGIWLV